MHQVLKNLQSSPLMELAKKFDMKFVTIKALQEYRKKKEKLVDRVAETRMPTRYGEFKAYGYVNQLNGEHHVALVKGDISDGRDVLCRVHSECLTGDVFGSLRCDCGPQLHAALRRVAAEGRGVVVLIRDLSPNCITEWVLRQHDPAMAKDASKERRQIEIGIGSQILSDLGVKDMILLTSSPDHVYVGLDAFGRPYESKVGAIRRPGRLHPLTNLKWAAAVDRNHVKAAAGGCAPVLL